MKSPLRTREWFRLAAVLGILFLGIGADRTVGFAAETPIRVATKESPPFSFKGPDGKWMGISIELWERIAPQIGVAYEFKEVPLKSMLAGLADGSIDAGVAALTINADRETRMDFSHPYYITGLGIAVNKDEGMGWFGVLERFLSVAFLKVIGLLSLVLLAFGFLVWYFERRANPDQFSGDPPKGLWSGFWWAAVTMTTVGYGDKAPVSVGGRIVALVWMFTAIIIISSFTAAITSTLTVNQLGQSIRSAKDLEKVRVATVQGSTSADYLGANRLSFSEYETVLEALDALAGKSVAAVVYDEAILRHFIRERYEDRITVLPEILEQQDYGIGLPQGSPLREPINRALLDAVGTPWWNDLIFRYLGK